LFHVGLIVKKLVVLDILQYKFNLDRTSQ